MFYLHLFCASVSKTCPQIAEKPKRAYKGLTLSIKLKIIKCFDCGERNKDVARLNFGSGNA